MRIDGSEVASRAIRCDGEILLRLSTAVPAIVLPNGFRANSAQGAIVDNWYQPGLASSGGSARGPESVHLSNAPNPFARSTTITYSTAGEGPFRLQVLDVTGRLVTELESGTSGPATRTTTWDGRDFRGEPVAAGLYFIRLEHPGGTEVRRAALLR